jgi:hypothetical protein
VAFEFRFHDLHGGGPERLTGGLPHFFKGTMRRRS